MGDESKIGACLIACAEGVVDEGAQIVAASYVMQEARHIIEIRASGTKVLALRARYHLPLELQTIEFGRPANRVALHLQVQATSIATSYLLVVVLTCKN